jgi:hypothetical protein
VGAEDESSHTEALRSFGVGRNVIDIDGFAGVHFAGAKCFSVDKRIWFTGADAKGIDANRKVPEKGETRLCAGHVKGVGIGKQGEAVVLGKPFEKGLRLDRFGGQNAIPSLFELFESERAAETLAEMKVPVLWRDPALLPVWPARIVFDDGPDFLRSELEVRGKPSHNAVNIHLDEDTADVEDNGAEVRGGHGLFSLGASGVRVPGTEDADDRGQNGKDDDDGNDVMNAFPNVWNRTSKSVAAEDHCSDP